MQALSYGSFVAVNAGCVDQPEARLQRPVGGVFRLAVGQAEHAKPIHNRHYDDNTGRRLL